jgi:hypothetical protein
MHAIYGLPYAHREARAVSDVGHLIGGVRVWPGDNDVNAEVAWPSDCVRVKISDATELVTAASLTSYMTDAADCSQ